MKQHQPADLVGKPVRWTYHRKNIGGTFHGVVRAVRGKRALLGLTVQRPGDNFNARTLSARCNGTRVRITADELVAVHWRGELVDVAAWLSGGVA